MFSCRRRPLPQKNCRGRRGFLIPFPYLFFAVLDKKAMFFSWKSAEQFDHLAPVRHALLVQSFKSAYWRKKAWNILGRWLQARGFPSFQHFVIRLPSLALCRYALRCFALMVDSTNTSLPEKIWAKSRIRARLCKATYLADNWSHVSWRRMLLFVQKRRRHPAVMGRCIWSGKAFMYTVRSSPSAELKECQESAANAFHFIFGNPPRQVSQAPISAELKRRWNAQNVSQTSYDKYVAGLVSDEVAFVPDDKNKKWARAKKTLPHTNCCYVLLPFCLLHGF